MPPTLLSAAQNPYLPLTALGLQNCGAGFSCTHWTRFTPTLYLCFGNRRYSKSEQGLLSTLVYKRTVFILLLRY